MDQGNPPLFTGQATTGKTTKQYKPQPFENCKTVLFFFNCTHPLLSNYKKNINVRLVVISACYEKYLYQGY